ncbi:MAG: O-antigen polymerase [Candidatus Woesebacteria bacterium GW2011_GWC2_33_12]|uniref:O-antigen polymerase n=1 Tax=Candidatus Woesebacteria bacterium GW2011_GWB1_33_22 TaxID=1618566 RepID=A0A0F9ZMK2_9BACT|nr:MAG: O-antigen polymerase [Candidatus Woesebacteria bacterium GW2011_GWC2_33_12]KKP42581.1 MAG: O-antigen polymerase [Candidatus Woesebacteria bacterium GW2011_GWA2_33_20]KKP45324.1 MAG: O-antigen polymerase [Candidatus Woesebacteria bacterium GW2011_GWB1_33_22]KKP47152.1 MAG: O-antigen polymerase [Microgenomates group bacterium GW2011_GWC1_33_28]KKP50994.1 MAG: O-antigen polymerase [Candidatus Woesebacteria bacterium GW2011_GWA1_33_33]
MIAKKFIFSRTILDWPLVIYLLVYLVSTIFSIDPRTSLLGYYSRFNGGLLSQICYVLLYWAFVSNLNKRQSLHSTYYILLSTAIASILAIGEHFGIFTTCGLMKLGFTESCWVQDVQSRVFSTLGQPNWLAALLVALIPITWAYSLRHTAYGLLSILFFVTLLFTKSRSGILAFGFEFIIFWGINLYFSKLKHIKVFLSLTFLFALIYLIFQSPFTGKDILSSQTVGPVLEVGGTESGTIRKYVWLGALNVFKSHPILGTGPETFAFSFPMYKPMEHNLTSEWDFIYNKAHNEFLNYLANTGILGFLSYLTIIITSIIIFIKSKKYDFLAGYVGILVTNFFGFSVVPVSLLFFLFPAMAVVSSMQEVEWVKQKKININQWFLVFVVLLSTFYILHSTFRYFIADIHFNKAKLFNKSGNLPMAKQEILKSLKISPNEPLYLNEMAVADNNIEISQKALLLSPYNINLVRSLSGIYNRNSNPAKAIEVLQSFLINTPSDPKNYYQIGIYYLKINDLNNAAVYFTKSVELKPNYKDARFALGLTYIDLKEFELAKNELKYILEKIDSKDELTQKYLDNLLQAQK